MVSDIASHSVAGARIEVNVARSPFAIEQSSHAQVNIHGPPRNGIASGRDGNGTQDHGWNAIEFVNQLPWNETDLAVAQREFQEISRYLVSCADDSSRARRVSVPTLTRSCEPDAF